MRLHEARLALRQELAKAGISGADREADLICAHLIAIEPSQLGLHLSAPLEEGPLAELLAARLRGCPLQYLLGQTGFMGLDFAVGPGVLIPRPDTEIVVERAISLLKHEPAPQIADICSGSGAIAVSLAYHLPASQLMATDISPIAIEFGRQNAKTHAVDGRCRFYQGDLLAPLADFGSCFQLIISNPPYLSTAEMAQLSPEVCQEPPEALFAGEDGLDFYRRLALEAKPLLKAGGYLLLEHGWQQQQQLMGLLREAGWRIIERLRDYGGRERGVLAQMKDKKAMQGQL